MQNRYPLPVQALSLILLALQVDSAVSNEPTNEWQQRRLMHPSPDEILWEQAGNIMIYDGLSDRQVGAAMDGHFPRIESMMFTGTIVTDSMGKPVEDPTTGEFITENDGCD